MALVRDERTTVGVIQFDPQPAPSLGTGFGYANGALWFDSGTNAFSAMINGVATPVASTVSVATLPATCTPGVTPPVQLSVSPFGVYNCTATNTWTIIGTVAGGSFGASPSSGYTFTSTPITASPFSGNFLLGTMETASDTTVYTAGTGWTLDCGSSGTSTLAMEHQVATSATSYSAAFTLNSSNVWGGTISAWTTTATPTVVQAKCAIGTSLAFTSNNTAGNALFAVIRYNSAAPTGPVTSITDAGNTWKLVGLRGPVGAVKGVGTGAGVSRFDELWVALNCASGAHTVAPQGVTGGSVEIGIMEVSGIATSNALVDYNYNADGTGNTATTTPAGATTNNQFLYQAINNTTGVVDVSGRDHAAVFRTAAANIASTGGQLYHKKGIYNGQTSILEVNNGQTNWYVFALPPTASGGGTQVYWDLVGETGTQASGNNQFGTIFNVLPSAYAGPAPSGAFLSALWQRPAPSAINNSVLFRNMTCRIPDNQRSPTVCFDSFQAQYSYHINTMADTAISYADQLCSGITPAATNIIGYRTNQPQTNESYFENTWAIGWNTPYQILSNHPVGINMHSLCNQNAGLFSATQALYGGLFVHFQDIHNISGPIFTCTNAGTRYDLLSTIVENPQSGGFVRVNNATETSPGNCVVKVDVTTASANGVAFNPPPFFASGSGANSRVNESTKLIQPGLVNSNFTSAATTGTTKQTLATYTFTFNTSGVGPNNGPFINNPGGVYQIDTWGITAATANNKTLEIDFGGTAIATITSAANAGSISCSARIIVSSVANTQEIKGECVDSLGAKTFQRTAPAIAGNANIVLNIAATTPTASGDFTFKGLTIEYVGGN